MSNGGRPKDLVTSDVIDHALKKQRITSAPGTDVLKEVGPTERPIQVAGQGNLTELVIGHREQVEEERRDSVVTKVTEPDLAPIPRPPEIEEEPPPLSDKSLLDKTQEEIQEEMQTVEEPVDDGAFAWYPKIHASVDKGQADEISPAVITAIVQARSGGNEEYIYGDAYGLFGMGASERAYVQQVLRETGELEPDEVMSAKEYNDWRAEPENQINFYVPMIHGFVLRGVEAGIKGRDLAEMVGKQVELPGSRVLPDGSYAKGYDTVTAIAQQKVNEEFPDGVPEKVRVEAGILSQDALREAGLKAPTRQLGLFEGEYADDVTPRMVTTAEGKPFEAGRQREWWETYLVDPIDRVFRPVKQWVGLLHASSERGQEQAELLAVGVDRFASLFGTAITAASGSIGAPLYAIGGFRKADTSSSDSMWESFAMKSAGALQAVGRRWKRAGEIWAPDFPGMEEDESSWEYVGERLSSLTEHIPDFGRASNWNQQPVSDDSLGWKEFKRIFVPGTQGWSEEELDQKWNEARDFSYTWMYDPDAKNDYMKDKAQVLAEINARRAMEGLPPRSLSYKETDELKQRHEHFETELVGEMLGDLTILFPGKLLKGVLSFASRTKLWTVPKAGLLKIPGVRVLLTEHVGSVAGKLVGRTKTVAEDAIEAFTRFADELASEVKDEAVRKVAQQDPVQWFVDAQARLVPDPTTGQGLQSPDSGGLIEALKIILRKQAVIDPRDGKIVVLTKGEGASNISELTVRLWADLGARPDMPLFTMVPHSSGVISRPQMNLWARNTSKKLGARWTALGRSWNKRLENIYRILKNNPKFYKEGADQAPADALIELLEELAIAAKNEAGESWSVFSNTQKQQAVMGKLGETISSEFKMKHGFAQGGKIYDMVEGSGTYRELIDAKTINPALMAGPRFFRALWIEANLSARPGFTVRNVFDSTFRALTLGGIGIFRRPLDKLMRDTPLPADILQGLQRSLGMGGSAAVDILMHKGRLPRFWNFKDWWSALRQVTKNAQKQTGKPGGIAGLPWPVGRNWGTQIKGNVHTPWGDVALSYSSFVEVIRDWNEALEVMLRVRLFDKFYHKIYKDMFQWWKKAVLNDPNLTRAGRQQLKRFFEQLPDRQTEVATMLTRFINEEAPEVALDYLIPEQILRIANIVKSSDDLLSNSSKQILTEIADELWKIRKKTKTLTEKDVMKVFGEAQDKLKKDFDDSLERIRVDKKNNKKGGPDNHSDAADAGQKGNPDDPDGTPFDGGSSETIIEQADDLPEEVLDAQSKAQSTVDTVVDSEGTIDAEDVTEANKKLKKAHDETPIKEEGEKYVEQLKADPLADVSQEEMEQMARAWEFEQVKLIEITMGKSGPESAAQLKAFQDWENTFQYLYKQLQGRPLRLKELQKLRYNIARLAKFLELHPSAQAFRPNKSISQSTFLGPRASYGEGMTRDSADQQVAWARFRDIMAQVNRRVLRSLQEAGEKGGPQLNKQLTQLASLKGFLDVVADDYATAYYRKKAGFLPLSDAQKARIKQSGLEDGQLIYLKITGARGDPSAVAQMDPYFITWGHPVEGWTKFDELDTGQKLDQADLQYFHAGWQTNQRGIVAKERGLGYLIISDDANILDTKIPEGVKFKEMEPPENLIEIKQNNVVLDQVNVDTATVDGATIKGDLTGVDVVDETIEEFGQRIDSVNNVGDLESIKRDLADMIPNNEGKPTQLSFGDQQKFDAVQSKITQLETKINELSINDIAQDSIATSAEIQLQNNIDVITSMQLRNELVPRHFQLVQGDKTVLKEFHDKFVPRMTISQYRNSGHRLGGHPLVVSNIGIKDSKYIAPIQKIFDLQVYALDEVTGGLIETGDYVAQVSTQLNKIKRAPDLELVGMYYGMPPKGKLTIKAYREQLKNHFEVHHAMHKMINEYGLGVLEWGSSQSIDNPEVAKRLIQLDQSLKAKPKSVDDVLDEYASISGMTGEGADYSVPYNQAAKSVINNFVIANKDADNFRSAVHYRDAIIQAARDGKELSEAVKLSAMHVDNYLAAQYGKPAGINPIHIEGGIRNQPEHLKVFNDLVIPAADLMSETQMLREGWELLDGNVYNSAEQVAEAIMKWKDNASPEDLIQMTGIVERGGFYQIVAKSLDMNKNPWDMNPKEFLHYWLNVNPADLAKYDGASKPTIVNPAQRNRLEVRVNTLNDYDATYMLNINDTEKGYFQEFLAARKKVLQYAIGEGTPVQRAYLRNFPDLINTQQITRSRGYAELPVVSVMNTGGNRVQAAVEMTNELSFLSEFIGQPTKRPYVQYRNLSQLLEINKQAKKLAKGLGPKGQRVYRTGWEWHDNVGLAVEKEIIDGMNVWVVKGEQEMPKQVHLITSIGEHAINYEPSLKVIQEVASEVRIVLNRIHTHQKQLKSRLLQYPKESDGHKAIKKAIENFEQADNEIRDILTLLDDRLIKDYPERLEHLARKEYRMQQTIAIIDELPSDLVVHDTATGPAGHNVGFSIIDTRPTHQLPNRRQIDAITDYIRAKGRASNATYEEVRLWALAELLRGSGLRVSEVHQLKWHHILEMTEAGAGSVQQYAMVKSQKYPKGFSVPLTKNAQRALKALKEIWNSGGDKLKPLTDAALSEKSVFLQRSQQEFANANPLSDHIKKSGGEEVWGLTKENVGEWIKKGEDPTGEIISDFNKIDYVWREKQSLHAHDFRRAYAVDVYNATGKNIQEAQQALGHQGPTVTAMYYLRRGGVPDNELKDVLKVTGGQKIIEELNKILDPEKLTNIITDALDEGYETWYAKQRKYIKILDPINRRNTESFKTHLSRVERYLTHYFTATGKRAGAKFKKAHEKYIKELGFVDKPTKKALVRKEEFIEEVARRSEAKDVPVATKMIEDMKIRSELNPNSKPTEIIDSYLEELKLMSDPLADKTDISYFQRPTNALDDLTGYRLYVGDQPMSWSPLYLNKHTADNQALYYAHRKGLNPEINVRAERVGAADSWVMKLGRHYEEWRRSQWLYHKDSILQHPSYAEIADNFDLWNQYAPGEYKAGLKEFHPLINDDAPLGYRKYLADLEARDMTVADLAANEPIYLKPNDDDIVELVKSASENAGYWNHAIRNNEDLADAGKRAAVELQFESVIPGQDPIKKKFIMVGPRQAYEIIPENEYVEYLLDIPEGYTEKVVPGFEHTAMSDPFGVHPGIYDTPGSAANPKPTLVYASEEIKSKALVRNHEIGHAFIWEKFKSQPDANASWTEAPEFFQDFVKAYEDYDNLSAAEKIEIDGRRLGYYWGGSELLEVTFGEWLTNPNKPNRIFMWPSAEGDIIEATDTRLAKVFKKHWPDVHEKQATKIRREAVDYDLQKVGLNYEGVKVKWNKKDYVLTNNMHFYPEIDYNAPLSQLGMSLGVSPVIGSEIQVTSLGGRVYKVNYAVIDLDELRTDYVWSDNWDEIVLSPEVLEDKAVHVRDFVKDPQGSAKAIRHKANNYVPEWGGLTTDKTLDDGILIDLDGNVLNGTSDVLLRQLSLADNTYAKANNDYITKLKQNLNIYGIEQAEIDAIPEMKNPMLVRIIKDSLDEQEISSIKRMTNPSILSAERNPELLQKQIKDNMLIIERLDSEVGEFKRDGGWLPRTDEKDRITFQDFVQHAAYEGDAVAMSGERILPAWELGMRNAFVSSLFPDTDIKFVDKLLLFTTTNPEPVVNNMINTLLNNYRRLYRFQKENKELYARYLADESQGLLYDIYHAMALVTQARIQNPTKHIEQAVEILLGPQLGDSGLIQNIEYYKQADANNIKQIAFLIAGHGKNPNTLDNLLVNWLNELDSQLKLDEKFQIPLQELVENGIRKTDLKESVPPEIEGYAGDQIRAAVAASREGYEALNNPGSIVPAERLTVAQHVPGEIKDINFEYADELRYIAAAHGVLPSTWVAKSGDNTLELADFIAANEAIINNTQDAQKIFATRTTEEQLASFRYMDETLESKTLQEWDEKIVAIMNEYAPERIDNTRAVSLSYERLMPIEGFPGDPTAVVNASAEDIKTAFYEYMLNTARRSQVDWSDVEKKAYVRAKNFLDKLMPAIFKNINLLDAHPIHLDEWKKVWNHLDAFLLKGGAFSDSPIGIGPNAFDDDVLWAITEGGDIGPTFYLTAKGEKVREEIIQSYLAGQSVNHWNDLDVAVPMLKDPILDAVVEQLTHLQFLFHNGALINSPQILKKAPNGAGIKGYTLKALGVVGATDKMPTSITGQHSHIWAIGDLLNLVKKPKKEGGLGLQLHPQDTQRILTRLYENSLFGTTEIPKDTLSALLPTDQLNPFHYVDVMNSVLPGTAESLTLKQLFDEEMIPAFTGSSYATAEDALNAINTLSRIGHEQMMMVLEKAKIPENLWFIGKHPTTYRVDDKVPILLLHALHNTVDGATLPTTVSESFRRKARELGKAHFYSASDVPNFGHAPDPADVAAKEVQATYNNLTKAIKDWQDILIGPNGNLNEQVPLDAVEAFALQKEILDAFQGEGGYFDQLAALKNTAMYGTKDVSKLAHIITPPPPESDIEKHVDTQFEAWKLSHRDGTDPHDFELFTAKYGPGSKNRQDFLERLEARIEASLDATDPNGQTGIQIVENRFAQWEQYMKQDPLQWIDWRTMKPTIIAKEGLMSLEQAVERLTPEELAQLVPGYYNWGVDVPLTSERVVFGGVKPHKVTGAVDIVGNAMVDYQTNTNLDMMMKSVFPFWIFPTRSLKFWLGELAAKPKILSTWSQIQGASERMAHDVGATDTRGHQLPRFRGNINLTGTNWWWNPTAALSFTQAIPGARNVYGLADSEAPIFKRLATYLYAYGPAAGFHVAPWISIPMHRMGWLDENQFPERSLLGQVDLIPEWQQRTVLKKVQDSLWYSIRPDATWTPEVSWKDFLVERQVLITLTNEIEFLHELDKKEKVKEAEMAILQRTGDRWTTARRELEQTDYFARIVGYLSGMYGKKFNKGEAALYEARDEVGRLRRQISLDANYEDFYKDYRYNTAEGLTYGLYKDVSWVTDETGKQLYGQARWDEVAKNIAYQQQMSAKIAREGANRRMLEIRLSELPIGSPWESKKEIYEDYETIQKTILKAFPDVIYQWGPYNKNDETIREHVIDKWMKILGEGRPFNWNREEQDWDQYQNSILEWQDDIPNIAQLNIDRLFMELAGEKLFEPLKDYEGQPLHQTDEEGNVLLDAKGEPVPETIFESVLGKRLDVKKALLAMGTSAEWNQWDINSDSLDDALNRVWLDNYAGAFFDFIDAGGPEEVEGSEREQFEREWDAKFPGGPSTVQLTGWIRNLYGDKWSDEQIALHRYGTDVVTREKRRELQASDRQKKANEIFKWYGWAGPRGAKQKFYDALEEIDPEMAEVLRDFLDPSRKRTSSAKGLYTYWSDEFWTEFYNAVSTAALTLELQAPTDQELEEWVLAEELDLQFHEYRETTYGPNWNGLNSEYFNKTSSERLEWRKENPDLYKRLQAGWTMKDAFGEKHPAWQKFFDPDVYHGIEKAKQVSGSGYSGFGATVTFGGENYRHSFAPTTSLDSYKGVSIEKLVKSLPRPVAVGQWPKLEVSQLALEELLTGKISDSTQEYLKKLHQKAAPYSPYETFLERLRELARSVLGDIAEESALWPWEEGYASVDTVSAAIDPADRKFLPQR